MSNIVSLVKGEDRYRNIYRSLELIKEDLASFTKKKRILIKPNLTATKKRPYANTHLDAVKAVLDFFSNNFPNFSQKEIVVSEGSGSAYYEKTCTWDVFRDFGYELLPKEYLNLRLEAVEDYKNFFPVPINSFAGEEKLMIAERINDFDFKISVNLPKTHNYAIATLGIKNMMGLVKQEDKSLVHGLKSPSAPNVPNIFNIIPTSIIARARRRMPGLVNVLLKHSMTYMKAIKVVHHNVAAFAKVAWPDLVVLDALYGMDGNGPVDGFPVRLNAAISSCDPLKADGIGARLIGIDPEEIGYLFYLSKEGLGDYSLDGLVGEDLALLVTKFKMHPTFPIQKQWK